MANKINYAALADFSNVGKKESLYKSDLFEGMTEKQKRAERRKIRRSRDNAIEAFYKASSKEEKKKIAKSWKAFAESVYKDIYTIFDVNTSESNIAQLANFTADMRKILTEAK